MILVSVIIPYFRKKNYIKSTIKSILNQSYKNFEILIIYDDFIKKDLIYLKKIKKLDPRIKIIINKKNLGAGLSRNKGIKQARGKYIAFIDADDLWRKEKLKTQLNFMKKNNYKVSHTNYHIIDNKKHKIGFRIAKNLEYDDLLKSCDVGLSTVMMKKEILKNDLFTNLNTKEDYLLWLKISKKNYKFYSLNKSLTYWRSLNNSLSSSITQKLLDGYYVYRVHLKQSISRSFLSLFILSINFLRK